VVGESRRRCMREEENGITRIGEIGRSRGKQGTKNNSRVSEPSQTRSRKTKPRSLASDVPAVNIFALALSSHPNDHVSVSTTSSSIPSCLFHLLPKRAHNRESLGCESLVERACFVSSEMIRSPRATTNVSIDAVDVVRDCLESAGFRSRIWFEAKSRNSSCDFGPPVELIPRA
jgi:hypothetical protein